MTVEIAIMNRSALAMAADSAVTIGASSTKENRRVWKTTNKLFSLSPQNDIGIMIFGAGDHSGIPWETIVKTFSQYNNTRFDTIEECRQEFTEFVRNYSVYDNDIAHLNSQVLVVMIVETIFRVQQGLDTKTIKKKTVEKELNDILSQLESRDFIFNDIESEEFIKEYGDLIDEVISECAEFSVSKATRQKLYKIGSNVVMRDVPSGFQTGVVFGGFGKNEYLPCMSAVLFDGVTKFGLRTWVYSTPIEMKTWKESSAFIRPFAQDDITHLFIEGIEFDYIEFLKKTIVGALNKKSKDIVKRYVPDDERVVELELQKKENRAAIDSFMIDFKKLRQSKIVDPILSVVRNLPKEEMAAMAEALVEITSLRRKMDSDIESVAGPVDVAVISKGDGLVWIKRKHYFDRLYNTDFLERRARRRRERG